MILSLGNNVYRHSLVEIACAILGITILIFIPTFVDFNIHFINTYVTEDKDETSRTLVLFFDIMTFIAGCVLLFLQVLNIVRFIVPDSHLTKNKTLTMFLRGSAVRSEFGTKQATVFKIHKMVQNAYSLHRSKKVVIEEGSINDSFKRADNDEPSNEDALLNFTKVSEQKELSGGFMWAWNMFFSGRLIEEEGVWSVCENKSIFEEIIGYNNSFRATHSFSFDK